MLARMDTDASKEIIEKADRPGVVAPPLGIYAVAALGAAGAQHEWPMVMGLGTAGLVLGGYVTFISVVMIRLAMTWFTRAGTTVNPFGSSSTVVCDGPFAVSRNPIYVGMTGVLVGAAGMTDSPWPLLVLLVVLPVMQFGVIRREEAYLERKFGADYTAYKACVRRWL